MDLNNKYPIYLKSGKIKVKLKIKEILVGQFNITQAILEPEVSLVPGKKYSIYIDKISKYLLLMSGLSDEQLREAYGLEGKELYNWIIDSTSDNEKPCWVNLPIITKMEYQKYGCGPESFVHFKFSVKEDSEFLIKANLTNLLSKKTHTYYLEPVDSVTLLVGKGMCLGAFIYDTGDEFEISFDLMDASGNYSNWVKEKIVFFKPKIYVDDN